MTVNNHNILHIHAQGPSKTPMASGSHRCTPAKGVTAWWGLPTGEMELTEILHQAWFIVSFLKVEVETGQRSFSLALFPPKESHACQQPLSPHLNSPMPHPVPYSENCPVSPHPNKFRHQFLCVLIPYLGIQPTLNENSPGR